jgi:hypothetical protein
LRIRARKGQINGRGASQITGSVFMVGVKREHTYEYLDLINKCTGTVCLERPEKKEKRICLLSITNTLKTSKEELLRKM